VRQPLQSKFDAVVTKLDKQHPVPSDDEGIDLVTQVEDRQVFRYSPGAAEPKWDVYTFRQVQLGFALLLYSIVCIAAAVQISAEHLQCCRPPLKAAPAPAGAVGAQRMLPKALAPAVPKPRTFPVATSPKRSPASGVPGASAAEAMDIATPNSTGMFCRHVTQATSCASQHQSHHA
jgi:hypothetical protein